MNCTVCLWYDWTDQHTIHLTTSILELLSTLLKVSTEKFVSGTLGIAPLVTEWVDAIAPLKRKEREKKIIKIKASEIVSILGFFQNCVLWKICSQMKSFRAKIITVTVFVTRCLIRFFHSSSFILFSRSFESLFFIFFSRYLCLYNYLISFLIIK